MHEKRLDVLLPKLLGDDLTLRHRRGQEIVNTRVEQGKIALNKAEILNASVEMTDLSEFPERTESLLNDSVMKLVENLTGRSGEGSPVALPKQRLFLLKSRCEQAPNPESRVQLTSDRDELGMRRVKLRWKLTDLDQRSWLRWMEMLGRDVGAKLGGRVRTTIPSDRMPYGFGGNHHIGTTRMHADPSLGVVDSDCRVHEVENLWIAGSSVFSTSGAANPTLTLIALVLRLASHLESHSESQPESQHGRTR